MKLDVMRPSRLIDINALAGEHAEIVHVPGGLRLGALARMSDVAADPGVRRDYPVIAQSLELAASPQLRNMATLGGNVLQRTRCSYFRDPSWAELQQAQPRQRLRGVERSQPQARDPRRQRPVHRDLSGRFRAGLGRARRHRRACSGPTARGHSRFSALHRPAGRARRISKRACAPDELIIAFDVPAGAWTRRSVYLKIRDRQSYEFALASAAVALELRDESIAAARIALGGVATTPWRAQEAEAVARRPKSLARRCSRRRRTPPSQARNRATAIATRSRLGKRTLMSGARPGRQSMQV